MNQQEKNQTNSGNSNKAGQKEKNTAMAVIAYILFFVPLFTDAKNDPFVKYHVHQGFALFLGFVATYVLGMLLAMMPMLWFVIKILNIALIILLIFGVMNAIGGRQRPLPLIGQFAKNFKF